MKQALAYSARLYLNINLVNTDETTHLQSKYNALVSWLALELAAKRVRIFKTPGLNLHYL
jgi:hypothetical protein